MTQTQAEPGSFRDPGGRVFRLGDRILRTVTDLAANDFDFVQASGVLSALADSGKVLPLELVDSSLLGDVDGNVRYVVEAPRIKFVSFPYEWSFSALKAAALQHLEIQLKALEKGVTLSDASAYNMQFDGANPVFIDHLSFVQYREGEIWAGHRQFCEQFLNPLLLRAYLDVPHNAWYRGAQEGISPNEMTNLLSWHHKMKWKVLTHVVLQARFQQAAMGRGSTLQEGGLKSAKLPKVSLIGILQGLHRWIESLNLKGKNQTVWQDYAKTHSYSSDEAENKRAFIREFAGKTRPKVIWDLGCNIGDHCVAALEGGAEYAVGFDFDQGALDAGFDRARSENLPLQTVYLDAANPSPNQGWNSSERQGLVGRADADGVMALAFIHHLAIARNIPFDQLLDWIMGFALTGVIEFVPKQDPMVQELLRFREDIFPEYTEEFFLGHIGQHARIVKQETVSASGRLLIWYDRSD